MKTALELEHFHLKELSEDELKAIEGGNIWWYAAAGAIAVYDAATDFFKGFRDGYNNAQK